MSNYIEPDAIPYGGELRSDDPYNPRSLTNPLTEPFTFHWNDKPHTLQAGETKIFPEFLTFHGARHLAHKILVLRTADKARAEKDGLPISEVLYSSEDIGKIVKELVDADKEINDKLGKKDGDVVQGPVNPAIEQAKKEISQKVENIQQSSKEIPTIVRRAGA